MSGDLARWLDAATDAGRSTWERMVGRDGTRARWRPLLLTLGPELQAVQGEWGIPLPTGRRHDQGDSRTTASAAVGRRHVANRRG